MARHPLKGSERKPLHGAKSVGKADLTEWLRLAGSFATLMQTP
jgi:hypothetical protein